MKIFLMLVGGATVAWFGYKLIHTLFFKKYGPSILSGPGPRYGFATVGPKKDEGK